MPLAFDSTAWIGVGSTVAAGVLAALASMLTVALASLGGVLRDRERKCRRPHASDDLCFPQRQRYWRASAFAVVLTTLVAAAMGASNAVIAGAASGAALGAWRGRGCELARRPCMAALLGSVMGGGVMSAGIVRYLSTAARANAERIGLYAAVFIGAMIFATSAIAFCQLRGTLRAPRIDTTMCAGHGIVNLSALLLCGWLGYGFVTEQAAPFGLAALLATGVLSSALGVHLMIVGYDARGHAFGSAAWSARCEGIALIDRRRLLARVGWHAGDEVALTTSEAPPRVLRTSASRHRRVANRTARSCASVATRRRAGTGYRAFDHRIASRSTRITWRD